MNHLQAFVELIFKEEPEIKDVALIVSVLAAFWAPVFAVTITLLGNYLRNKPWYRKLSDSDYEREWKTLQKIVGLQEDPDEYYQRFLYDGPYWLCVCCQHVIGGALCLPALLGMFDPSTNASLACLGIMSEISYEITDTIGALYRRYFTPNGKQKVPVGLLVLLLFHHSFGSCLGIPMILYYREMSALHWLCAELQGAAAVALAVQWITKALDVSDRSQRRLFLQLSGWCFAVMILTRVIHFPVLVGQVLMVWYQEEAWTTLAVAIPLCIVFSIFNYFFCVVPGWKRMAKFWNMPEEQSKPVLTATSTRRRSSSAAALKHAAAALLEDSVPTATRRRSSSAAALKQAAAALVEGSSLVKRMDVKLD